MREREWSTFRTNLLGWTREKTLIFSRHSSTFYLIFIFLEDDEVIKWSKLYKMGSNIADSSFAMNAIAAVGAHWAIVN